MTNAVAVSAPGAGVVGQGLAVTGTVAPAGDQVSIVLSMQNATLPTGPFATASTANGVFAGALVPVAPGIWYAWAWDQTTGVSAVSGPVAVGNTALQSIQAVPISVEQAASLLGGSAAGETVDELPAAAEISGSDTAIVAQGAKNLLTQPFSTIAAWIFSQLPGFLRPTITVTTSVALDASEHNARILNVTAAGVTISPILASLGDGFDCTVLNTSGSPVALSGIATNTGSATLATGQSARIIAYGPGPSLIAISS
jgi:hypothetical protein